MGLFKSSLCLLLEYRIATERLDKIITHVGGVPIDFDVEDLNNILGIPDGGHKDHYGVRNICRRRDLTNDICALSF